jgi:hypothetical protein
MLNAALWRCCTGRAGRKARTRSRASARESPRVCGRDLALYARAALLALGDCGRMVVQHVNVAEGGQAIVTFQLRVEGRAHCPRSADQSPIFGLGSAVSIAGDARHSVSVFDGDFPPPIRDQASFPQRLQRDRHARAAHSKHDR